MRTLKKKQLEYEIKSHCRCVEDHRIRSQSIFMVAMVYFTAISSW